MLRVALGRFGVVTLRVAKVAHSFAFGGNDKVIALSSPGPSSDPRVIVDCCSGFCPRLAATAMRKPIVGSSGTICRFGAAVKAGK